MGKQKWASTHWQKLKGDQVFIVCICLNRNRKFRRSKSIANLTDHVVHTYRIMEIKALICLFAAILQQTQWQMIGGSTTATTKRSDSNNQPIHCYVCYSCNRVETSQSLPCPSDHDRCMVSRNKRQRLFLLCNFSSI